MTEAIVRVMLALVLLVAALVVGHHRWGTHRRDFLSLVLAWVMVTQAFAVLNVDIQ